MTTPHPARRAISLYSFQEAYYLGELSLEQCVAAAVRLGAPGIEVLAEQMMPGFPHLSDEFYDTWAGWMDHYQATPLAHDMFLDTQLVRGRTLSTEEQGSLMERELRHASRLGCRLVRVPVHTPPAVMVDCLSLAERLDVAMLLEVHTPWHIEHPWIQAHLEAYEPYGSAHLGLIPDFGIFVERFPRLQAQRALRDGVNPDVVAQVTTTYDEASQTGDRRALDALPTAIAALDSSALARGFAAEALRHVWSPPETLLDVMDWIGHVHGKFWEITGAAGKEQEYSIPYPRILAVLERGGYTGTIASEYEGQIWQRDLGPVDELAAVSAHQQLLARLLVNSSGS